MWPLTRARIQAPGHDPAPSRMSYRLNRMWLSPLLRRMLTAYLPVTAVLAVAAAWLAQPQQRVTLAEWAAQVRSSVEARPEFQIRQMAIVGASPVLADAIRRKLDLDFPVSWFDLDAQAIHDSIAGFDAVASVDVVLELGGALTATVLERQPAVIWRNHAGLEMLDATGHRIAFIDHREGRPDLPLVTGEGADQAIPQALTLIETAAPLAGRVRGLTRQGARRWDVILDRGQIIRLPETDPVPALERVLAMEDAMDLLARDVPVVDMRNVRRPTIRLGAAALDYLRVTRAFEQGQKTQ
ncbi:MAG: cell division protein FtsQ/DivIB [Qingshengfaniella sp.]